MTNQTPESVIAEVIEYHADAIGSHYDGCHKHHAVCLAVKLRDMLREYGMPDAATERVAELEAELASRIEDRDYWYGIADKAASQRDAANEDRKQAEAEIRDLLKVDIPSLKAERDAALAAISDARALCLHLGGIDGDVSQPAPSYYVSVGRNVVATEVLAALDGAPEPEVKP